jgi:transposase InsO family protein
MLSIAQFCDLGLSCTFDDEGVTIANKKTNVVVFKGFHYGNLYLVDFASHEANLTTCLISKTSKGWLWHRRIAHIGMSQLKKDFKKGMVLGVKQVASHHPMKAYVSTTRPLELMHMDLSGLTTYKSLGGNLYCLVIVDDYSRYTWTFFLKDKGKTFDIFKKFATRAQNEFGLSMVKIRTDNGSEFSNIRVEEYCDGEGIKHEFSSTYTPEQNGVVERKNKTHITLARAMLDDYGLSQRFWVEAINTACHASNRVYLRRLLMKTPYEQLIGTKPNISYF